MSLGLLRLSRESNFKLAKLLNDLRIEVRFAKKQGLESLRQSEYWVFALAELFSYPENPVLKL